MGHVWARCDHILVASGPISDQLLAQLVMRDIPVGAQWPVLDQFWTAIRLDSSRKRLVVLQAEISTPLREHILTCGQELTST